jgi:hypothetical protein
VTLNAGFVGVVVTLLAGGEGEPSEAAVLLVAGVVFVTGTIAGQLCNLARSRFCEDEVRLQMCRRNNPRMRNSAGDHACEDVWNAIAALRPGSNRLLKNLDRGESA